MLLVFSSYEVELDLDLQVTCCIAKLEDAVKSISGNLGGAFADADLCKGAVRKVHEPASARQTHTIKQLVG